MAGEDEMLRGVSPERSERAQHDTTGFGRSSSLSRTPPMMNLNDQHQPSVGTGLSRTPPMYRPGERTDGPLAAESTLVEHPSIFSGRKENSIL
jgi:hypothetical protein